MLGTIKFFIYSGSKITIYVQSETDNNSQIAQAKQLFYIKNNRF